MSFYLHKHLVIPYWIKLTMIFWYNLTTIPFLNYDDCLHDIHSLSLGVINLKYINITIFSHLLFPIISLIKKLSQNVFGRMSYIINESFLMMSFNFSPQSSVFLINYQLTLKTSLDLGITSFLRIFHKWVYAFNFPK